MGQRKKILSPHEESNLRPLDSGLRLNSLWGLRIFSLSQARDKTKNIFLYFFSKPKTYHLSYSMYKFQKNKNKIHASTVCYMLTNLNLAFSYFSILIFYDIFTAIWCRFVVTWTSVLGIAFLLLNKLKEKYINVFSWIVTTTSPWSFFVTFIGIILWEK